MKLRELVEGGMDFGVAFRALIPDFAANMGMPGKFLTDIAARKGVQQTAISAFTNGSITSPYPRIAEVVSEISGEDLEWVKEQGQKKRDEYQQRKQQQLPV